MIFCARLTHECHPGIYSGAHSPLILPQRGLGPGNECRDDTEGGVREVFQFGRRAGRAPHPILAVARITLSPEGRGKGPAEAAKLRGGKGEGEAHTLRRYPVRKMYQMPAVQSARKPKIANRLSSTPTSDEP